MTRLTNKNVLFIVLGLFPLSNRVLVSIWKSRVSVLLLFFSVNVFFLMSTVPMMPR